MTVGVVILFAILMVLSIGCAAGGLIVGFVIFKRQFTIYERVEHLIHLVEHNTREVPVGDKDTQVMSRLGRSETRISLWPPRRPRVRVKQ